MRVYGATHNYYGSSFSRANAVF